MEGYLFGFSDNHNLNIVSFAGAANGRVAGHCGICPGCKKTEDRLQMTLRQRYLSFFVHANRYLVLEYPSPMCNICIPGLLIIVSITRLVFYPVRAIEVPSFC
jgi:hypothetical protein